MSEVRAVYQPPRRAGLGWRSSVLVSGFGEHEQELWVESTVEQPVSADPFALMLVPLCLTWRRSLHIDGPVSASLWRNLYEFTEAFHTTGAHRGSPSDTPPPMSATLVREPVSRAPTHDTAIVAFSGGIDSTFSMLRHTRLLSPECRHELTRAVIVHGFDVPISDGKSFHALVERVREIPESVGLELVQAATNYRDFRPDWEMSFGAAVASILNVCRGDASHGLIPASVTYDHPLIPWGSGPHLDHLFSSSAFAVVDDGSAFARFAKVEALAQWPEIIPALKFCWQGPDPASNCGKCPKCVITWIQMQVSGIEACPFSSPPSERTILKTIKRMRTTPGTRLTFGMTARMAEERGVTSKWVRVTRRRLNPSWWRLMISRGVKRGRRMGSRVKREFKRRL